MLDLQAVARLLFKWFGARDSMGQEDSPEDRLEAALERIAKHLQTPAPTPVHTPDPKRAEIAAQLDQIIATLRQALGK
jgi:hypothetical protein